MNLAKLTPKNLEVSRERGYDYGPFPPLYYAIYWMGDRAKKYFGARLKTTLNLSKGAFFEGKCRWILGYKRDWDALTDAILQKVKKDRKFLSDVNKRSRRSGRALLRFSQKLLRQPKKEYTVTELIKDHRTWIHLYQEYSLWNSLIWLSLTDKLTEYVGYVLLNKYGLNANQIQIITTPNIPSYAFVEELELTKIGKKVDFKLNKLKNQSMHVRQDLARHAAKWCWMPYEYIGPKVWTQQDFLDRILKFAKKRQEANRLIREKLAYLRRLKTRQNFLVKKYKISREDLRFVNNLRQIATMQDEKKYNCSIAQYALQEAIFKRIADKLHLSNHQFCMKFTEEELSRALKRGDANSITKLLPERLKAISAIATPRQLVIVSGNKAIRFYDKFNPKLSGAEFLKGQIASRGTVRGLAKILNGPYEIAKVKRGNILMAPMTTPDYVPAMRRAAAIVTNEGGMTSHAAIVSRELGIPCIVGTKIATSIFKNGDLVEVDANKGVVRKLK